MQKINETLKNGEAITDQLNLLSQQHIDTPTKLQKLIVLRKELCKMALYQQITEAKAYELSDQIENFRLQLINFTIKDNLKTQLQTTTDAAVSQTDIQVIAENKIRKMELQFQNNNITVDEYLTALESMKRYLRRKALIGQIPLSSTNFFLEHIATTISHLKK